MIPSHVGNRALIRQLELWGYSTWRTDNDRQIMVNNAGREVICLRAHIHSGPDKEMLKAIYKTVCDGNAELFWSRSERLVMESAYKNDDKKTKPLTQKIDMTKAVPVRQRVAEQAGDSPSYPVVPFPCDHIGCLGKAECQKPGTQPQPAPEKHVEHGISARVLAYMEQHPHQTFTSDVIALYFGVDRNPVINALGYLAEKGHVERVMRGAYRLAPKLAAKETVHHAHTGPVEMTGSVHHDSRNGIATGPEMVSQDSPADPFPGARGLASPGLDPTWDNMKRDYAAAQEALNKGVLDNVSVVVPTQLIVPEQVLDEDDMDALLEMILPKDYVFAPVHLKAMRRWQAETAKLLHVLRSEK